MWNRSRGTSSPSRTRVRLDELQATLAGGGSGYYVAGRRGCDDGAGGGRAGQLRAKLLTISEVEVVGRGRPVRGDVGVVAGQLGTPRMWRTRREVWRGWPARLIPRERNSARERRRRRRQGMVAIQETKLAGPSARRDDVIHASPYMSSTKGGSPHRPCTSIYDGDVRNGQAHPTLEKPLKLLTRRRKKSTSEVAGKPCSMTWQAGEALTQTPIC